MPLKAGLAAKLVDDPQVLIELMAEFLNGGVTFMSGNAAEDFLNKSLDSLLATYADTVTKLQDENAKIRQNQALSQDIAALLGGVDLVFVSNHRRASYAGGIKDQSWVAGTSGHHGLCGQLTWRVIWDPADPNVLTIQFYGDGQSYSSAIDGGNNEFVCIGFPIMVEMFQYKMNNGLKGKTYDEV